MAGRIVGYIAVVAALAFVGAPWAAAQGQGVDVQDDSFSPATVTVSVGDTVTWTQSGSNPHSVTADDGSFDSHPGCPGDCMGSGDTFSHTFDSPGEFGYHCKVHGSAGQGMAGTVVVEAAEEEPAPEPEEEPEDEPADTPAPADESAEADDGAAEERDRAGAADDGQQIAETGGRWALLPVGLVLFVAGVMAVRHGRAREA